MSRSIPALAATSIPSIEAMKFSVAQVLRHQLCSRGAAGAAMEDISGDSLEQALDILRRRRWSRSLRSSSVGGR